MRLSTMFALPALLAAFPAQAQDADRDLDGHYYCSGADGLGLREVGDGTIRANLALSYTGDVDNAVYPPAARGCSRRRPSSRPMSSSITLS
ncbi:MAG: hypothetical protein WDN24_00715 [Sphingomonas sp.]